MEFRSLYITVGNKEEARKIASVLLEERLVACTNLFDGVESRYWWEGKIATDREVVLIAKTRAAKASFIAPTATPASASARTRSSGRSSSTAR